VYDSGSTTGPMCLLKRHGRVQDQRHLAILSLLGFRTPCIAVSEGRLRPVVLWSRLISGTERLVGFLHRLSVAPKGPGCWLISHSISPPIFLILSHAESLAPACSCEPSN
jgi:hypothetical protein